MAAPFVHLEILGPRAALDAWCAALQDHGGCHPADAMAGLEGEAGLARPAPTEEEREAALLRSRAAHALRGVERILPSTTDAADADAPRPAWTVSGTGAGAADVEASLAEALERAGRLRDAQAAARGARRALADAEARVAALDRLEAVGRTAVGGRLHVVADAASARRLARRLGRAGARVARAATSDEVVVLHVGGEEASVGEAVAAAGARPVPWAPPAGEGADLEEGASPDEARPRLVAAREAAREGERQAGRELREAVARDGAPARRLLDALEDAEARFTLRERLAATRHVAAARVWVPREGVASLRRRLEEGFGREVVVRDLAPADDAPAWPRTLVTLPLEALDGLRPGRFGRVAAASLLALLVPLAAGLLVGDLVVGLLWMLGGALVGLGAGPGTPRRDTALLAQVGGLAALAIGVLQGRALGRLGAETLGGGWGLAPFALSPSGTGAVARDLLVLLGLGAGLLALWGIGVAIVAAARGRRATAGGAIAGALVLLVVAGAGAAACAPGTAARPLWVVAPLAAAALAVLSGPARGLFRLLLELGWVARLVFVAAGALLLLGLGLDRIALPEVAPLLLGAGAILLALLALVVDPAHVAMGVPYDLSLGAGAVGTPYAPLRRRAGAAGGPS